MYWKDKSLGCWNVHCMVGVDNRKEKEEEQQRSLHSSMRYQNDTKVCMGGGVCLGLWIMK